jgi:hypothetical protein
LAWATRSRRPLSILFQRPRAPTRISPRQSGGAGPCSTLRGCTARPDRRLRTAASSADRSVGRACRESGESVSRRCRGAVSIDTRDVDCVEVCRGVSRPATKFDTNRHRPTVAGSLPNRPHPRSSAGRSRRGCSVCWVQPALGSATRCRARGCQCRHLRRGGYQRQAGDLTRL